jgi:hypothetical protein
MNSGRSASKNQGIVYKIGFLYGSKLKVRVIISNMEEKLLLHTI